MSEHVEICSFCELLKDVKSRSEIYANTHANINGAPTFGCKAALVVEDYSRSEFGGRTSYNPRPLNFCPMCGRELAKEEIEW